MRESVERQAEQRLVVRAAPAARVPAAEVAAAITVLAAKVVLEPTAALVGAGAVEIGLRMGIGQLLADEAVTALIVLVATGILPPTAASLVVVAAVASGVDLLNHRAKAGGGEEPGGQLPQCAPPRRRGAKRTRQTIKLRAVHDLSPAIELDLRHRARPRNIMK